MTVDPKSINYSHLTKLSVELFNCSKRTDLPVS